MAMIWNCHSIEYILMKIMVRTYGLSLVVYSFSGIVSYGGSICGYKYWLSLGSSTETLDRKILWSDIKIWLV